MVKPYVVTGTLSNGRVVTLDVSLPLGDTKVRVSLEPLPTVPSRSYGEVMAGLRRRQKARGHVPPTRDEVDRFVRTERQSWGGVTGADLP